MDRPMQYPKENSGNAGHYYGDIVRRLFLAGAVIMLVTYPYYSGSIPESPIFTFFAIVLVVLFAGITNPRQRWIAVANMIIAGAAVLIFEFYGFEFYRNYDSSNGLFLVNQALALIFVIAFYFSVKTLRGAAFSEP